jgi:hypothetical protein
MQFFGVVIHHSVCPSINGKGYDFFIAKNGMIIPASEQTDSFFIHICLEGDYSRSRNSVNPDEIEQLFLLKKLILKLAQKHHFSPNEVYPHSASCPGKLFPWSELVISSNDEYH